MEKIVLFVLLDHYADLESAYLSQAIHELAKQKLTVKTVSLTQKPIHSFGGFTLVCDYNVDTYPNTYQALILIGSPLWKTSQTNALFSLIDDALQKERIVASIGSGAEFMAVHGFFNAVNHTANSVNAIIDYPQHNYTNEIAYQKTLSVRDGTIVSANHTGSLEFARDTMRALELIDEYEISEWYAYHKLGHCLRDEFEVNL